MSSVESLFKSRDLKVFSSKTGAVWWSFSEESDGYYEVLVGVKVNTAYFSLEISNKVGTSSHIYTLILTGFGILNTYLSPFSSPFFTSKVTKFVVSPPITSAIVSSEILTNLCFEAF